MILKLFYIVSAANSHFDTKLYMTYACHCWSNVTVWDSFLGYVNLESLKVSCSKPLSMFFPSTDANWYYLLWLWQKSLGDCSECVSGCGFHEVFQKSECEIWNAVEVKYRIVKVKWDSFKLFIKMYIEVKNNDRIRSEEEKQLTC